MVGGNARRRKSREERNTKGEKWTGGISERVAIVVARPTEASSRGRAGPDINANVIIAPRTEGGVREGSDGERRIPRG